MSEYFSCWRKFRWRELQILLAAMGLSFLTIPLAMGASDTAGAQCTPQVTANDVVMSDQERREVAYHVQPAGVIPQPGQWPYFAWSDTPIGVVRTRDDSGYLFFGSDGGCHANCSGSGSGSSSNNDQRWGSITRAVGAADDPLGKPFGDPNPPVTEFLLPTSTNLPDYVDYVGGGPVHRVSIGEPGAGNLLIVYHVERPANPFWSWLGLAKSEDEGLTWQDLGIIIGGPQPYTAEGALDIGDGNLMVTTDPATSQKYFYIFFPEHCWINSTDTCSGFTYLSVARAPYEELLRLAFAPNIWEPLFPATGMFFKYHNGEWNQPGVEGKASELFPTVTDETDGDPQVVWSAYRNRFVAIMDNAQYVAYGESIDGLHWPPMQILLGTNPQTPVYAYANAVGSGNDPGILGDTFYSYYTAWPLGTSWQPATLNRLTITYSGNCDGSTAQPSR